MVQEVDRQPCTDDLSAVTLLQRSESQVREHSLFFLILYSIHALTTDTWRR